MSGFSEDLNLNALYDLSGRVALVTGGGTGIGLMISRGLAENGAKVYIAGRRKDVLEGVKEKLVGVRGQVVDLPVDVTNKESISRAVETIRKDEGRLHILVNNSGQVGPTSPFLNDKTSPLQKDPETLGRALFNNESFEGWESVFSVNTTSIFFVTNAFLGLLAKGSEDIPGFTSSVINITSISGLMKLAQRHFAYNSTKAAASHLTKMLSTEYALRGIPVTVNAVAPGAYASEMTIDVVDSPKVVDAIVQGVQPLPAARAGTAEEMAGTVIYLASRAGCYTNGQEIVIDGGALAVNPSTA